jgi:hypothetical protein
VADSLAAGAYRLVLVLDEAPGELAQLVGYLESISTGVVLDLIAVSSYEVGDEQILVPQRVDPEHASPDVSSRSRSAVARSSTRPKTTEGTDPLERTIEQASAESQAGPSRLVAWVQALEQRNLASLRPRPSRDRMPFAIPTSSPIRTALLD